MGKTLTHSRGKMSSVAIRAFLPEFIFEVTGHTSAREFLQQIIQQVGVVCSGRVSQSNLMDTLQVHAPGLDIGVVIVVVVGYDSLQRSDSGLGRP